MPWITDIRYLGIGIVRSGSFKCSLDIWPNTPFIEYRTANAVFGKIGTSASQKVVLKVIHSRCVPILLYGLEAYPLNKAGLNSLGFAINLYETLQNFKLGHSAILPGTLLL